MMCGYPNYGYGDGGAIWIILIVLIIFFILFWGNNNNNYCNR